MKIIMSPAKKMRDDDSLPYRDLPVLLPKTKVILEKLRTMSFSELQKLWNCNYKIAEENLGRLERMDTEHNLTPAVLAYDGIAFQHMAPSVFDDRQFDYVQAHVRILSGFYGVLKPLDGIRPYRLEMQASLSIDGHKDLYSFWGRDIYEHICDDDGIIINLASKEYSKCAEKYLSPENRFITCVFAEKVNGKMTQKATFAKMARGEMVRFLAEREAGSPEIMKDFTGLGYNYRASLSSDNEYVFERVPG